MGLKGFFPVSLFPTGHFDRHVLLDFPDVDTEIPGKEVDDPVAVAAQIAGDQRDFLDLQKFLDESAVDLSDTAEIPGIVH